MILDVLCPQCLAKPGEPCVTACGYTCRDGYHRARERSARTLKRQLVLPFVPHGYAVDSSDLEPRK